MINGQPQETEEDDPLAGDEVANDENNEEPSVPTTPTSGSERTLRLAILALISALAGGGGMRWFDHDPYQAKAVEYEQDKPSREEVRRMIADALIGVARASDSMAAAVLDLTKTVGRIEVAQGRQTEAIDGLKERIGGWHGTR